MDGISDNRLFYPIQPNAYQTGTSIYEIGCIGGKKSRPDLSNDEVAKEVLAIVLAQ